MKQVLAEPLQKELMKIVQKESFLEYGFSNDGKLLKVTKVRVEKDKVFWKVFFKGLLQLAP